MTIPNLDKQDRTDFEIPAVCLTCGKPLVNLTDTGTYCEDYCGLENESERQSAP